MKFKIDENLPIDLAKLFRAKGHDVLTVLQQNLGGTSDTKISKVCRQENRALLTLDVDFADIRVYPPDLFPGIIVMRLKYQDKSHILNIAERLLKIIEKEPLDRHIWIVEEDRVRISGKDS